MGIKTYEVKVETPFGRYLSIIIAAPTATEARHVAMAMVKEFRGAPHAAFQHAEETSVVSPIAIKTLPTEAA